MASVADDTSTLTVTTKEGPVIVHLINATYCAGTLTTAADLSAGTEIRGRVVDGNAVRVWTKD